MQTDWFYWADSASVPSPWKQYFHAAPPLLMLTEKSKLGNKCVVIDECFS
jgi:hypothetical protein